MNKRIPTYRLNIIDKLEYTYKQYAKRVAEILKIDGISDFKVEMTMCDTIIELEKRLESKQNSDFKIKCNGAKILGTRPTFIIIDDIEQGL